MFTRVWRFRPVAGAEGVFERVYGPTGVWVALFRRGPGYLGTELQRLADGSGEYLTLDRWESRAAWEAFRREHAAAYEALDRQCKLLIETETLVDESLDRAT